MASILVTGVNGVVGLPLSQRLQAEGLSFNAVSRTAATDTLLWDLQYALPQQLKEQLVADDSNCLIHCAPIWLLPDHLQDLKEIGIRRIVVFSSSSVISKARSNDSSENELVRQLSSAEQSLTQFCDAQNINLTIFRPSMIYGYAQDQNITHIAKFVQRYGCMLLVGKASGLRQPVHADDLVEATLAVLDKPQSYGKTYTLAGAEVLNYRQMVERVFIGLNKKVVIFSLPLPIFRLGLKIAAFFGRFSYTAEMANRINQNLIYDNAAAQSDFAYEPQAFLQQPQRDLPSSIKGSQ